MHPFLALDPPHLFGHRGACGVAPENTLISFERAWEAGVAYLETDCHATRDGEIVLLHDATVDRTTDGEGPVSARTYAELTKLDAAYRFTPDRGVTFPFRGQGVRIPRLADLITAFPDARINLEIKQAEPDIAEQVLRVIRRAGADQRLLLAAEDDAVMASIQSTSPQTALGTSTGGVVAFFEALRSGHLSELRPAGHALQIPPTALGEDLVTSASVEAAHSLGLVVHVWTINEPAEMRRLLELGVDGLMSDFPTRLFQAANR
ncbi:MAG: glycerophosphodiester phosphodiesterase [Myxococcota bacterium]